MKRKLLIILFIVFIYSCKEEENIEVQNKIIYPKETIVNFISKPKDTIHLKSGGRATFSPTVNITYDNGLEKEISIEKENTIYRFNPENKISLIRHVYRMEDVFFEIGKGDSIVYFEDDGFPNYRGSNRLLNLSNQYESVRKKYLGISYPSSWFPYVMDNLNLGKNIIEIGQNYTDKIIMNSKKEMFLLDSLFQKEKITRLRYFIQKEKILFDKYDLFFNPALKNHIKDSLLVSDIKFMKQLDRRELLKFKFYRDFLDKYINYTFKIKKIKSSHKNHADYRTLFDSISNSNRFNGEIKKYLLYNCMEQIAETFSPLDFQHYLEKFQISINDSILSSVLKRKYVMDLKTDNTVNVQLVNRNKEKQTIKEILDQNKRKIIYIDFWASWCAPCLATMPAAVELRKEYEKKDVVFLYVSIDKNREKWKKASEKITLDHYQYTFLAINYPQADFYENINLTTIPRYLLYDKNGKLIHQNAPGPDSREIRELLNKYLAE